MKTDKALLVVLAALMLVIGSRCANSNELPDNPEIMEETAVYPTTETVRQSESTPPSQYDDPFAYCAAVGTIDELDEQYSGSNMPDAIIQGMVAQAVIVADAPLEIQQSAVWRCMDSQVWVCHFGANLPCLQKADVSTVPAPALEKFCRANPEVEGIPTVVTGRATMYKWGCKDGKPEVIEQIFERDSQGYLADFWYELTPDSIGATQPNALSTIAETANNTYTPVSPELCQIIQATASQTLTTTFTIEASAPFTDTLSGEIGLGCRLMATGTGIDFPKSALFVFDLPNAFSDWTEQLSYQAGGPTGMATGLTSDMGLMLIYAGWEPAPNVECPTDQPLSACSLKPEQMLYTIEIQVAQK